MTRDLIEAVQEARRALRAIRRGDMGVAVHAVVCAARWDGRVSASDRPTWSTREGWLRSVTRAWRCYMLATQRLSMAVTEVPGARPDWVTCARNMHERYGEHAHG